MDKLLELSLRSIIQFINNDETRANVYKAEAIDIYKDINFRDKCIYKVEDHVPKVIKNKLYELVS